MSLTTCVRKAGSALSAPDKAAILEAARANRKAGMSADEAAKAAVRARLEEVQAELASLAPQLETVTSEPKTLKERAEAMAAKGQPVHQDPGQAPEVATKAVVTEAVRTAAGNRDRKPSEMRAELLRMVDEAILETPDYQAFLNDVQTYGEKDAREMYARGRRLGSEKFAPDGYSRPTRTFKVPGDGTFTVNNTVGQLMKFRRAVETSPGFADRPSRYVADREPTVERGSATPKTAVSNMIDEGDPQAAVDYAAARGLDIAEVLKGDKARLGKVAGLAPTAEAVGEFEPEAAPEPAPTPAPAAKRAGQYEPSEVFAVYRAAENAARGLWSSSGAGKHNTKLRQGLRELGLKQTQIDSVMAEAATVHAQRTRGSTTMSYLSGQDFMAGARRAGIVPEPAAPAQPAPVPQPAASEAETAAQPAAANAAEVMVPPMVREMLGAATASAEALRERVTDVRYAPTDGKTNDITFKFDGKSMIGSLRGRNADAVLRGRDAEGDRALAVRVMLDGDAQPAAASAARAESAARRINPVTTIDFAKPIVGPTGARLKSYTWQWKPMEFVDARGEERVKRISDWDASEASGDTGREVVHQFVVDDGGADKVVSAESALKLLGFTAGSDGKAGFTSLSSAAKTLARLRMQEAELQQAKEQFDRDKADVMAMSLPAMPTERDGKGWFNMGDASVRQIEPGAMTEERRRSLIGAWRDNRMAERGWRTGSEDTLRVGLRETADRIKRQQAKVDRLVGEAASAAPPEPWKLTREQAAKDYPGDEYDRMLNRHADLGDLPYTEADRRARINSLGQRKLWAKTRAQIEQEGKDAVKAARGDRAAINKLKSTPEFASWRLKSMSATGKQAIADAERLARDYLAIHKDRVQEALMEGKDVPAEVLADYPDLQRPASAAPPAQQAEPSAPAEPDYLAELFGTPEQQAAAQAKFTADAEAKTRGMARVRDAIAEQKKRAATEYDEWAGKVYKQNKTQVDLRGDGPSNQASMSIGAINESRRRNAMEALSQEMRALDKLADEVSTDSGAERVQASLSRLYEQAAKIAADGTGLFKTADEQFQYMLLDDLKFRGPSGKGNVTSNGLSKAMLAAIKPSAPAPAEPTTLAIEMGGSTLDVDLGKPVWQATEDEVQAAVAAAGFSSEKRGKYDPMMAWREAHGAALNEAKAAGKPIPARVLYDNPRLIRDDLSDDQADQAADAMVDTYRATKDYERAVQAYRDFGKTLKQRADSMRRKPEGEAAAPIADVGEKIGGARKDMAVSTGTTRRKSDDDRPAWARRFKVSQIVTPGGMIGEVKDAGRWIIRDDKNLDWMGKPKQIGGTFATKEEADAAVPIAAVSQKHRVVMASTRQGEPDRYEIWRDITDRKRVKVVDQQFDSRDEAMRYMAVNAVQILETSTTFGEADMPLPPDRARSGPVRRTGNVTGADFKDAFGLRGVEFGNWNNQDERQSLMNDAWDGLMDLADVLGIPPKAIGLNGDLALAFGARGHGLQSARAHYELERAVINLTKERGAGSLAHEWFHALDHYLGRQDGKSSATWEVKADGTRTLKVGKEAESDMVSSGFSGNRSKVRPEVRAAYEALLKTMTTKAQTYVEDTVKVDRFTGTAREELARSLDSLRRDLAEQKDVRYWKRNNAPAPAEVLAEFDGIAKAMLDGDVAAITTDWRLLASDKGKAVSRYTNDALERLSAIYKQVRGRSGFDGTNRQGVLDRLRGNMTRYSERLKLLADAQSGAQKTKNVPTEFAMNARELDQGRGGDYWTTPHEMAARAFQGYVEDKIAERGGVSRFLNYGPENAGILTPWGFKRPFPAGEERKAINAAMDKFVGALQTKTDDAGNVALFSRTGNFRADGFVSPRTLRDEVAKIVANWDQDLADVEVVNRVEDLPADIQQAVRNVGSENTVRGLAMPDGRVYLVAENISTMEEGKFVLFHEVYGHVGMRAFLGDGYSLQMRALRQANPALAREADAWFDRYGEDEIAARVAVGFPEAKARQMVNDLAVEEALADRAGDAPELKGWQRLLAALQRGLRRLGLGSVADMLEGMTEAETLDLLVQARRTVQAGQRIREVEMDAAMSRIERAKGYTHQVVDMRTGKVMGLYQSAMTARRGRDRLDNQYGGVRYKVEPYGGWEAAKTAEELDAEAQGDAMLSRRRDFLLGMAAAAAPGVSSADVTVGRAKPVPEALFKQPLPADIAKALRGRGSRTTNLEGAKVVREALDQIAATGPTELRGLARQIRNLTPSNGLMLTVDDTGLWNAHGAVTWGIGGPHLKLFTAEGRTGLTYGTFLHEILHVGVLARYQTLSTGILRENDKVLGMSAPAAAKEMEQFRALYEEFRAEGWKQKAKDDDTRLSVREAMSSPDEFFVRALTDGRFQEFLAGIEYRGKSMLERFKDWVKSALFGLSREGTAPSWLDAALLASNELATAMTRDPDDFNRMRAISRVNSQRSALFSRRTSQDILNTGGGVQDFSRYGKTKQDRLRGILDKGREFYLGALTRDQIADVYGGDVPQVREYDKLVRSMENERSSLAQRADDLYQRWAKLDAETNDKLGRIMLDATTEQVHPDSDDAPADKTKVQIHAKLRAQFKLLPREAQDMYREVRDFHSGVLVDIKAALIGRIERQVAAGAERAALLSKVQDQFDQYLENGPYFPLSRFGDYLVIATRPDGERVVAAYENSGEQQAAARELRKDGFTTKLKTAKEYARSQDGSAGKFIGDMIQAVEKVDMVEATINGSRTDLKNQLLDDLNQLFIRSLPDLSYRKHFAHRKNTPGFSADVMRGFASSSFHAASYIARLNHADRMTMGLQSAYEAIDNAAEGDFNTQSQVLNELSKRHEAMLNPNTHPLSALATQVGFVMYLGLSPAAGLINMLQVPMVTIPYLGARYGFDKASAAMGKAYADIMKAPANRQSGFNAAQSLALSAEERQAISTLQDEGVIDLTQAHDLAAATDRDVGDLAKNKTAFAVARAMRIVGWTFHVPEVMNRQTTALMAYRLEREKGSDHEAGLEAARETIKRTQFDYSTSNRARYMQGNIARVVLQFKQFSQNMTYFLGRAAYQALKGETPEVRKIARRQILSTFVVTGTMAGSLGLPGIGAAMGLVAALVSAMDDQDEPWDWQTEYRNALADQFGKEWGEVFAKGVPRMLMPGWDIANRVSLNELWWRSNDREGQNPRESFATDMANILGPTAGTLLGWYVAADHMSRGSYDKAVEAVVPKFIRDPLKAYREANEGVTSYTGDPLMDVNAWEVLGRSMGFAPARVSEMYEGRNAVMNVKTALEERRQRLINEVVNARLEGDRDAEAAAREKVAGFNSRNPDFRITNMTIARSLLNRRRNRENTEQGILLPDTKAELRERARFANVE